MTRKLLLVLTALCLLALPAAAQTSEEAGAWLRKLTGLQEKAPFSLDIRIAMGTGPSPMPIGSIDGSLLQGDAKRMRLNLEMTPPADQEGVPPMKFTIVADGTHMWNEVNMGGFQQVFRSSLAETGQQAPGVMGAMGGGMDPLAQLQQMSEMADFQVTGKDGGNVRLHGKLNPEAATGFGQQMPGVESVTILLSEETGFPTAVFLGDEARPFVKMSFTNLRFLEEGEIDEGAFSYTPPEGVPVMDATPVKPQGQ